MTLDKIDRLVPRLFYNPYQDLKAALVPCPKRGAD